MTEEALRAHIDAACARIGDEAFLSGGVERLRQVERRNSETAGCCWRGEGRETDSLPVC